LASTPHFTAFPAAVEVGFNFIVMAIASFTLGSQEPSFPLLFREAAIDLVNFERGVAEMLAY
jgi:hypothetical protein